MNHTEIFAKTFEKMPDVFLSKEFYGELRKTTISETLLDNGTPTVFLKKVATQPYPNARTWYKKQPNRTKPPQPIQFTPITPEPIIFQPNITEQEAIAFLKEKGYKIFKYTEL